MIFSTSSRNIYPFSRRNASSKKKKKKFAFPIERLATGEKAYGFCTKSGALSFLHLGTRRPAAGHTVARCTVACPPRRIESTRLATETNRTSKSYLPRQCREQCASTIEQCGLPTVKGNIPACRFSPDFVREI